MRYPLVLQAHFVLAQCAPDIVLTDDLTTATKMGPSNTKTSVVLTRPSPDAQGSLTVTWRHTKGRYTRFGWALPTLDPTADRVYNSHGCFIGAHGGFLYVPSPPKTECVLAF